MSRVQLRVFARLQDEATRLGRAVERGVYVGSLLAVLAAALIVSQARPFIEHVVTDKWSAALPLLYLLAPTYLMYSVVQPIMQALKALGDAHTPLQGVLLQGLIQIATFLTLARFIGLSAYALGLALGLLVATVLAWRRLRMRVRVRLWRSVRSTLVAGVLSTLLAAGVNRSWAGTSGMLFSILCCVVVYALCLAVLDGRRLSVELSEAVAALLPASVHANTAMRNVAAVLVGLNVVHRLTQRGVVQK